MYLNQDLVATWYYRVDHVILNALKRLRSDIKLCQLNLLISLVGRKDNDEKCFLAKKT